MEIQFDYWLGVPGKRRLMHTKIDESDILDLMLKRFRDGEEACPINYDRETIEVEFVIDKVII
jgi:hypothetical protein